MIETRNSKRRRNAREVPYRRRKTGPRDVVDCSMFFFLFLYHFIITNTFFRYQLKLLSTGAKRMTRMPRMAHEHDVNHDYHDRDNHDSTRTGTGKPKMVHALTMTSHWRRTQNVVATFLLFPAFRWITERDSTKTQLALRLCQVTRQNLVCPVPRSAELWESIMGPRPIFSQGKSDVANHSVTCFSCLVYHRNLFLPFWLVLKTLLLLFS